MTTRVPRGSKLESLGRGWGYGGARTHHGEGGEGLRDEASDRGGEHSLLGHGSLGDGGLGDWIRRGIRGLGISSDLGILVERARALNFRRGGSIGSRASRLVGSGALTGGLAGNLAGRGLCEGEERGAKDRGQRSRRRQIGRAGRELVNNRRARRKICEKKRGAARSAPRSRSIARALTGSDRALHGEGHAGHFVCGCYGVCNWCRVRLCPVRALAPP